MVYQTSHNHVANDSNINQIPQLEGEFTVSSVSASQSIMTEIRTALRDMSQDVENFQNLMSYANEKERATIDLPRQFITAWLHIVSGLISALDRGNAWLAHVSKAKVLMMDGMNRIVQGISSRNLLDDSAVLPLEVLSLFSLNLLHDQVGKAEDIMDTYAQYLTLLVRAAWTLCRDSTSSDILFFGRMRRSPASRLTGLISTESIWSNKK